MLLAKLKTIFAITTELLRRLTTTSNPLPKQLMVIKILNVFVSELCLLSPIRKDLGIASQVSPVNLIDPSFSDFFQDSPIFPT
jgi:hypothetical protein